MLDYSSTSNDMTMKLAILRKARGHDLRQTAANKRLETEHILTCVTQHWVNLTRQQGHVTGLTDTCVQENV